jgi:hypothetical protein
LNTVLFKYANQRFSIYSLAYVAICVSCEKEDSIAGLGGGAKLYIGPGTLVPKGAKSCDLPTDNLSRPRCRMIAKYKQK